MHQLRKALRPLRNHLPQVPCLLYYPTTSGLLSYRAEASLTNLFLDDRSRPSRPRTVKISKTRDPSNRKAVPFR
ncbi:hypothetical protein FJD36_13700 [Pseudomonas chlororaphis subsp. chlororaphis]|nr:hypothetical protein FJD36_13700 [Pseudomonas chlororaphis subsp. chlororaphis]